MLYHLFKNFNYNKNFGESLMMKEDLDKINNHILRKSSKKQAYVDCTMYTWKMKKFVYGTKYDEDEVKGISLGYIKFQTIDMYYSYLKSLILHRKAISSNQHTNENTEEIKLPDYEIESSDDEIESSDDEIESSDDEIESSDDKVKPSE